jgi:two-component system capsular synthesis response regulator RcsB
MRTRIILADDHPVVLLGVRAIIESSGAGVIVAEATNPSEALEVLAKNECDVFITDLDMPSGTEPDGLSMITTIRRRYPELPMIVLSVTANASLLKVLAAKGVLGLINKRSSIGELPAAILAARRGVTYWSRTIKLEIEELGDFPGDGTTARHLSPKELEVLRMLATGATVSQIAERTSRSITTISRQKGNAMRKLGLQGERQLFQYLQNGGFSGR